VTATHRQPLRIPRVAAALRLPLWQRGQAKMRQRWGFDLNSPDAEQRVRALVAEKPDDTDRVLLLGSVLAMRGNNEEAEREVRRALAMQPDHARAHTTLATLLVQRGENAEGLQEARRAAELDGDDPTVQYNLGLAEWSAGDRRSASAAFDRTWRTLYGEVHPGAQPPWWRKIFRRGTLGAAPPSAGGTDEISGAAP
jgi:predicted Zn-dependent protease